jgi:hypothetical protein
MRLDRGYISPYFVTDPKTMKAELENPYILIVEKKVSGCACCCCCPCKAAVQTTRLSACPHARQYCRGISMQRKRGFWACVSEPWP